MKRLVASFLVVFALAGGVLSGMPLHEEKAGMMNCCPKAKHRDSSTKVTMARLCCALNCTDAAPISSGFSASFASPSMNITDAIRGRSSEIVAAASEAKALPDFGERAYLHTSSPIYLKHHSFRI